MIETFRKNINKCSKFSIWKQSKTKLRKVQSLILNKKDRKILDLTFAKSRIALVINFESIDTLKDVIE